MILMRGKHSALRIVIISAHVFSYETISDLMQLQDQIESFQKMVFSHFRVSANNECRISSLVPLVKESWGIYRFITSMLRAMYRSSFRDPGFLFYSCSSLPLRTQGPMIWKHSNPFANVIILNTIVYASSIMSVPISSTSLAS